MWNQKKVRGRGRSRSRGVDKRGIREEKVWKVGEGGRGR